MYLLKIQLFTLMWENPMINLPSRNGRFISPMYEDLGDDLL